MTDTDEITVRMECLQEAGCYHDDPEDALKLAARFSNYVLAGELDSSNKKLTNFIYDTEFGENEVNEDLIQHCVEESFEQLFKKIRAEQIAGNIAVTDEFDIKIKLTPLGVRASAKVKEV